MMTQEKQYIQIGDLEFVPHALVGGTHAVVQFPNGFGASVVTGHMFYTDALHPFEIAVLTSDGHLTYDTHITDDVLGYLTLDEANDILRQIQDLEEENERDQNLV
jgi:hypothetical protein